MVWKPFRFQRQSRWIPRRNNLRRNKKPGNTGFFIACRLAFSKIFCFSLGSLGRTQAPHLFRIGKQWSVNLNAIPRLNDSSVRVGNYFAEDTQRALRQIQFGKLGTDTRCEHCSSNRHSLRHTGRTQDLTINGRVHDLYLDHRLNHASAWHADRTHPPAYSPPD